MNKVASVIMNILLLSALWTVAVRAGMGPVEAFIFSNLISILFMVADRFWMVGR